MSFHFIRTFVECFRERNKSSKRNAFSYSNYTNRHKHRMPRERERKECNFPCYLKKKMSVNGKTAPTTDTRWDTLRTTGILQVEHRKKNTDNGKQTKRKKTNERGREKEWADSSLFSMAFAPFRLLFLFTAVIFVIVQFFDLFDSHPFLSFLFGLFIQLFRNPSAIFCISILNFDSSFLL